MPTAEALKKKISIEECPICLESLNEPFMATHCGHSFCKECIEKSMKKKNDCPVCVQKIEKIVKNFALAKMLEKLRLHNE